MPRLKVYSDDETKAKLYNHRLETAEKATSTWLKSAAEWYSRYENVPKLNQLTPKGHRVNVPTGVGNIDALYSALTAIEVDIRVTNLGNGTPEQAELATAALHQEWNKLDVNGQTQDAVKDALIARIGWAKVAYEYETVKRKVPRPQADIEDEIAQLIQEAQAAGEEAPDPASIASLVPLEEDQEVVLVDRIVVDYAPYDRVLFDPTVKRVRDIRWVAQVSKERVEDVRQNPAFRAYCSRTKGGLRRLDELKADSVIDKELLTNSRSPDDDDKRVTVVEMWDLETGTVCTFAKGQNWLLNETVNPFAANIDLIDRSPFVPLILRSTTRRVTGISDMELIAPTLDELNVYRSKLANYVERFVPKVMGPEDALTPEGQEALSSGEYGAYVSTAREYGENVIRELSPPVLPSEVFQMIPRLEDNIREATGVNELMRGLFPDRKRTATETAEVVSASAARQSEKRNTLEAFYRAIARRMLQLMQQFYDQPRMLQYVDESFGSVPWEWSAEDIIFDHDIEVHLTPREARTKQVERDEAMAELNMLGPFAQPGPNGDSIVKPEALVARFCRKFGMSRAEVLELLNLPEERQAAQLQQLQGITAQAQAAAGQPNPGLTTGPLTPAEVTALTNQGQVPPEVAAAAVGGTGPLAPQAAQQVSESAGVKTS
jgi:hypothetical protein